MAGVSALLNGIRDTLLGIPHSESPYCERVLIGSQYLDVDIGSPSILLVPVGGTNFGVSQGPGYNANPPVIKSRDITFDSHCWGKDFDDAEMLADAVLTALRRMVSAGNAQIDGEVWAQHGTNVAGEVLVRSFRASGFGIREVRLPLESPMGLATAQTVRLTGIPEPGSPTDDGDASGTAGAFDVSIGVEHD